MSGILVMSIASGNYEQNLLLNLLKATASQKNEEVREFLQANLDKLNDEFALQLRQWTKEQFTKNPAKAIGIAKVIYNFSQFLHHFELGNPASNLEIAIAGYEIILHNFNRESFPKDWDTIQQALVDAYQKRQKILFHNVNSLKQNIIDNHFDIKNITDNLHQELQQAKLEIEDLKTQISQSKTKAFLDNYQDLSGVINEVRELKQRQFLLEEFASNIKITNIDQFNTAVLYDIENLTMGSSNPDFDKFSFETIQQKIEEISVVKNIAFQYAYADWTNPKFKVFKKQTQEIGIETIQIFDLPNKKNSADIHLAIDAIDLVHSKPSLQVFVIVSGDGGFASLVNKLHKYGKVVIICAYEKQTSKVLSAVCDQKIWLSKTKVETSKNTEKSELISDYQKVLQYLKTHKHYRSSLIKNGINISKILPIFKEKIKGFDYKKEGHQTWKKYLKSICTGTEFEIVELNGDKTKSLLKIKK